MSVPAEIFKAYDIRGIHGEQLGPDAAEQIGRAFARVIAELEGKPVGELRLGLGRDMRLSAPEMAARYRAGMVAEGAHVDRRRARSGPRCCTSWSARASSTAG